MNKIVTEIVSGFQKFIDPMTIYFICVALAYILGGLFFVHAAHKAGKPKPETGWVLLLVSVASFLGAKWAHVLFEASGHELSNGELTEGVWSLLAADPWHAFRFSDPGYVFYGGLLAALGVAWKYGRYRDHMTRALSAGLFVGRLGCFWVGCCHGIAGLPVQLYEAGFALWLFWKNDRFEDWLKAYACWRFGVEFLRADASRGFWAFGLSTSQWVSLLILAVLAGRGLTSTLKSSQIRPTRIRI